MTSIDRALRGNLKLRHLQLVVALDQFRHLGRTAEFLSVTQPAVSKMLSEVEALLGLQLFERSTRGTVPTPQGESIVRFARSVLAEFERTRDEIAAVASGAAGRVRVGAMVVATPGLLAEAVQRFKATSPRSSVLVEEGDLTRLLPRLRLGELDFFVGRLEPGYAAPDLVTEALYDEPMVVVVRRGHPLADKPRPAWTDLAALPMVLPPPWASLRVKIEQQFFRHKRMPPVDVIETASFLALTTFVHRRGASALVARSVARHFARQGLFAVLPMRVPLALPPVGLITLRGRRLAPGGEQLIQHVRHAATTMTSSRPIRRPGATR